MPLSLQLLSHFKGYKASETESCQKKRALRLDRKDFLDVVSRDFLNWGIELPRSHHDICVCRPYTGRSRPR